MNEHRRDLHAAAPVRHVRLRVGDLTMHYREWAGRGPPLVLMHATGFHGGVWTPLARRLASEFRVLAPDQRGHGDTDPAPDGNYRWEAFGDDLDRFLAILGLDRVSAVGHSKGATAIAVCARAHPGRIARAVLIEPVLFTAPGPETERLAAQSPLAEMARRRRSVWESRAQMQAALGRRATFETWQPAFLEAYVREGVRDLDDGRVALKCAPEIEAQVYQQAPLIDGYATLAALDIPLLVVRGERSPGLTDAEVPRLRAALRRGDLATVGGAGHFVPMENPEEVERLVREFFARHPLAHST